jgi:ATP-dependent Lon protease
VKVTQDENMSDTSASLSYEITGRSLPILPVRDTVLFPHAVLPLTVGRESSVQLINSLGDDKTIVVVAQR